MWPYEGKGQTKLIRHAFPWLRQSPCHVIAIYRFTGFWDIAGDGQTDRPFALVYVNLFKVFMTLKTTTKKPWIVLALKQRKLWKIKRKTILFLCHEPSGCISPSWSRPVVLVPWGSPAAKRGGVPEQRGHQHDPGEHRYFVRCLGQTRVSLPEWLIGDRGHIMVRGIQPNANQTIIPPNKWYSPSAWETSLHWQTQVLSERKNLINRTQTGIANS